jgi:hypothetical protein
MDVDEWPCTNNIYDVSTPLEQRTDAFAAEFLLSRSEAKAYFDEELVCVANCKERDKVINKVIKKLGEMYEVGHELIAWQIRHSGAPLDVADMYMLKKKFKKVPNACGWRQ